MSKMGFFSQKYIFFMFLMASALLILSFVLRSTGQFQSLDKSLVPNSDDLAMVEDENVDRSGVASRTTVDDGQENVDKGLRNCEILKVFMYNLPPQFHFRLLGWEGGAQKVWPDVRTEVPEYPGGLNLQHSIEYWLTLDLLNSEFSNNLKGRNAVRVHNSSEADVVFVPFFASISYNRYAKLKLGDRSVNDVLQEKLIQFLTSQEEWKRSGGKDHIIVAHHPNSLLYSRMKLWPVLFILADFGRYPSTVANVDKDVIAPYMHLTQSYVDDKSNFDSRPTLLYFQGAIYRKSGGRIRHELFYMLKREKDVHFAFGSIKGDGIQNATLGMQLSKFCLNIAGDTPSSNRLFDAIASHCVPVIISDEIELPFEDIIDYSEFCVFVRASDSLKENFLINLIRNISKEEWTAMWERLKEVEHLFEFHYPSIENDAVQMIWQSVLRRVPAIRRKIHKADRFSPPKETEVVPVPPLPRNFWPHFL